MACGPPANVLWLFGCVHKSGTSWLQTLSTAVLPQGAHMLEYANGRFYPRWEDAPAHACRSPETGEDRMPGPGARNWSAAADALLSPACVETALRTGGILRWWAMGLETPPRLQPAVGEARAAPRLRVLVMARSPLQIVLSAYFYHQIATEMWAVQTPSIASNVLRKACEEAWPSAPPADACAAALRLLRNESAISYQELLKKLPTDSGVHVEAWRSLDTLHRQHATLRTFAPSPSAPLAAWVQDLDEICSDSKPPEYAATLAGILRYLGIADAARCAHDALSWAGGRLNARARLSNDSIHVFDPRKADTTHEGAAARRAHARGVPAGWGCRERGDGVAARL